MRGFTLLELILVLVVIGFGASFAAARLNGMRGTVGVDMAAQRVVDQARRCQSLAITSGQLVRLRFDLTANTATAMLLDGTREHEPADGQPPMVELAQSADDLTMTFVRSDAVNGDLTTQRLGTTTIQTVDRTTATSSQTKSAGADKTIDLLFSPDQRCDPPGTLTLVGTRRQVDVRLYAGARLPKLATTTVLEP
ncbi:MAG TPA: prepilin-type N-terminal cleavage/methylation domain-containing protein [Planctomycetota bacterium]|nr:prepilin-type N-terminal cleavage/methylation domain-containing protein [Planctomycetota bacterium]